MGEGQVQRRYVRPDRLSDVVKSLVLVGLVALGCRGGPPVLRLGTTHTVQQSGALAALETGWPGPPFATVVGPSGQILRAAATGDECGDHARSGARAAPARRARARA